MVPQRLPDRIVGWDEFTFTVRYWQVYRAGAASQGAREEVGLNQNLESVADADDGFTGFDESAEGVAEVVDELVGEDFAGGDVVAVAKAAGEGEDFKLIEGCGFFENAIDME